MNSTLIQKSVVALLALSLGTACSMKDRSSYYGIKVQLPASAQQSLAKATLFDQASTSFSAPTGITGMQCFALNITGAGLKADPRFGCKKADQTMGLMAGMAPVAGGVVDAIVPAGPARLIQLIGLQSTVGCPSFESLLNSLDPNNPGKGGIDGVGDPYLLGSTTIDVFGDTSVNIKAAFDPNKKLFDGCGDGDGNGGAKELTFQTINQANYIEGNYCAPISIEAHNVSSAEAAANTMPAVMPVLTGTTGGASVQFYTDASCTSAYSAGTYLSFGTGQTNKAFYAKTATTTPSTFTVQLQTTATGWLTPEVTYHVTTKHIAMTVPTPGPANPASTPASCGQIALQYGSSGSMANMPIGEHFDFWVYNNSGSGVPSAEFYYSAADCSAQTNKIVATSSDNKSVQYDIVFSSGSYLFVRDPVGESLSPSVSSKTGAATQAQPTISSLTFSPYSLTTNSTQITRALDGSGTTSLSFAGGTETVITGVTVNGQAASGFSVGSGVINFTPPAMASAGTYTINLITADGRSFPTSNSVQYISFASGNGTAAAPYLITSATQFLQIGVYPGQNYKLMSNINLSGLASTGTGNYLIDNFAGNLDGNGKSLTQSQFGLFSLCNSGSSISNLTLDLNLNVNLAESYIGGVCGDSHAAFSGVTVTGNITNAQAGTQYIGGIVGKQTEQAMTQVKSLVIINSTATGGSIGGVAGVLGDVNSSVQYAVNSGSVTGGTSAIVGGLIGTATGGQVIESYSLGAVAGGSSSTAGGLVGSASSSQVVLNKVFSTGPVTSQSAGISGGLVGALSSGSKVTHAFAKGNVTGGSSAGGLIGTIASALVDNSYATGSVTGAMAGGFTSQIIGTSTVTQNYALPSAISGATTGLFSTSVSGTINQTYIYANLTVTVGLLSGVNTLTLALLDNLTGYAGFSSTDWTQQTLSSSAGSLTLTPTLKWLCTGYPDAGVVCPGL